MALYKGGHSMVSPRSLLRMSTLAKTGGCTYLFLFFFLKISSAAILYAVQQANVGLFCSVLLSFHLSHLNTFQHLEKKANFICSKIPVNKQTKNHSNKWIQIINVLQVFFFSLPNIKWCFIFRLGRLSYAKHI